MTMTPTEKDAMALAAIDAAEIRCGPELAAAIVEARAHLASRIAELEAEIAREKDYSAGAANRVLKAELAERKAAARATRAEAELSAVRGLLIEIRGDCEVAYGVSEHNYRQFCDSGAMGRMPSDTWARHCQRRIEQIDAARGGE